MDDATARQLVRRLLWGLVVVLVVALIGAAAAVELWSLYWHYSIGIIARLTLIAVVAVFFTAVHMLTRA